MDVYLFTENTILIYFQRMIGYEKIIYYVACIQFLHFLFMSKDRGDMNLFLEYFDTELRNKNLATFFKWTIKLYNLTIFTICLYYKKREIYSSYILNVI